MGIFTGGVKMSEDVTFITNEKGNKNTYWYKHKYSNL